MAQYLQQLDGVFHALADPTRREVLSRLGGGPASVSELAEPFEMALPSFMKHIHYLESTGWISTHKSGRVRTCVLERRSFDVIEAWLSEQRDIWAGRTDRLERFVTTTHDKATD